MIAVMRMSRRIAMTDPRIPANNRTFTPSLSPPVLAAGTGISTI